MTSIMNNKYNIKETHNVSEASSFEDRKIKSGLKTSTLRNNKTMNNKYIELHKIYVRMHSSPKLSGQDIRRLDKTRITSIKETHNVSELRLKIRKIKSGLKESALSNNKTMNNDYRTTHNETR